MDVAAERLHEALDIRRRESDDAAELRTTVLLGTALMHHYRVDEGIRLLEPAVDRWASPGTTLDADRVALLAQFSRALFFNEDNERSIAVADRALPAAERLDALALVADLLITRGTALGNIGRYHEGQGAKRAGIRLADEHGLISTSLRGRINLSANEQADPTTAFAVTLEALEAATKLGRHGHALTLLANAASSAIEVGEWDWGLDRWMAEVDRPTDEHGRMLVRWNLASLRTYRGDDVADEVAELVAYARVTGDKIFSIDGLLAEHGGLGRSPDRGESTSCIIGARDDSLNGPDMIRQAGILALMGEDPERARAALDAFAATGLHRRLWDLDWRLIAAGAAAQTGATRDRNARVPGDPRCLSRHGSALPAGPGDRRVRGDVRCGRPGRRGADRGGRGDHRAAGGEPMQAPARPAPRSAGDRSGSGPSADQVIVPAGRGPRLRARRALRGARPVPRSVRAG